MNTKLPLILLVSALSTNAMAEPIESNYVISTQQVNQFIDTYEKVVIGTITDFGRMMKIVFGGVAQVPSLITK